MNLWTLNHTYFHTMHRSCIAREKLMFGSYDLMPCTHICTSRKQSAHSQLCCRIQHNFLSLITPNLMTTHSIWGVREMPWTRTCCTNPVQVRSAWPPYLLVCLGWYCGVLKIRMSWNEHLKRFCHIHVASFLLFICHSGPGYLCDKEQVVLVTSLICIYIGKA